MEQINPTTWKEVAKDDPKDRLEVVIGDDKQEGFYPQVKLERWDNEANFSVRLKDTEYERATVSTLDNKIIWDKDNIKIEFYEGDNGYKFIPYLKSKPIDNVISRWSVKKKGCSFYRQPPLTEEYQNGYSEEFKKEIVVTETDVKDLEGNVLVHRPENIVNSYAIYHNTKGGMNDIYGKDYKVGKLGQDYRVHLYDNNGLESWGDIEYIWFDEENGERIVRCNDEEFLDKAVYPIKSNDDFGYKGIGGTQTSCSINKIYGGSGIGGAGTAIQITARSKNASGNTNVKGLLIKASDKTIISNGITDPGVFGSAAAWYSCNYSTSPTISAILYYIGVIPQTYGLTLYYDSSQPSGTYWFIDNSNSYTTPTNPTDGTAYDTYRLSIYATYTPSGGGEETAAYTPLSAVLTIPSITATYVLALTSVITALSLVLTVPSISASYVQEESATYTPVPIEISVPAITASSVSEQSATFTPLSLVITIPSTTASSDTVLTASFTPLSVVATIPAITATYESELDATFTPLSLLITSPAITATSESELESAYTPLSVVLTIPSTTATYESELDATFTPTSLVLTIPSITASSESGEESAVFTPVSLVFTIPANTATYESELSAVFVSPSLILTIPSIKATSNIIWFSQDKSTSIDPTNLTKNSISPTNLTKNSIAPTNLTKNSIDPTNSTKHSATFNNLIKS